MPEFLAIYWRNGRTPLSAQVKKGLAKAFTKFNGYQLAKYNRDSAIKLRDVLFLVHAKPVDKAQETIWTQLIDGTLPAPDTWEVGLSRGDDKAETFTRLLQEEKLGYLALLRNLRNMMDVGVDTALVEEKIITHKGRTKALPFRFVAAARACPQLEPALDQALQANIEGSAPLPGKTVVLVDVSYSMTGALSARSDLTRMDAACALAGIINGDIRMFSFSNDVVEVPPRRGMAAVDALKQSQEWSGTNLALAVDHINDKVPCDRLIVITDEQSTSWGRKTPDPKMDRAYMINVASYKNGVGYGKWAHIDGFSEAVLSWIHAFESEGYE